MRSLLGLLTCLVLVSPPELARAATIPVAGYDIENGFCQGHGGFFATYTGAITPSAVQPNPSAPVVCDYTGGSGSLNDGTIATGGFGTHFLGHSPADGRPVTLTVHFAQTVWLDSVELWSMNSANNGTVGAIAGATVSGGGATAALLSTGFGPPRFDGAPMHDRLSFAGTALDGVGLDSLTLTQWLNPVTLKDTVAVFSLSEVRAFGSTTAPMAAVPLPGSLAFLALALGALARQRRHPTPI